MFANQPETQAVWLSRGDRVVALPEGFSAIAGGSACEIAAIGNTENDIYAVQYHPRG